MLQDENVSAAIDLVHLRRQTLDDQAIEREVLGIFVGQLRSARESIAQATGAERGSLAHRVKGAALGVGAFRLAEVAARIERDPADDSLPHELGSVIDETCAFVAAIGR